MNRVFYITKAAFVYDAFLPGQKVVSKHQNFYSLALNAVTKLCFRKSLFKPSSLPSPFSLSLPQMCSLGMPLTCNFPLVPKLKWKVTRGIKILITRQLA